MLFPSSDLLTLLAFVTHDFQYKTSLVDDVGANVSELLEPFSWIGILELSISVLSVSMDSDRLILEFKGLDGSLIIIEDPALGQSRAISFLDHEIISNDIKMIGTAHLCFQLELHTNLEPILLVELSFGILSVNFGIVNIPDGEFLLDAVVRSMHIDILAIGISACLHDFSIMAVD